VSIETHETMVRYVRLRADLAPLTVLTLDDQLPSRPEMLAITLSVTRVRYEYFTDDRQFFNVCYYKADGTFLTDDQYEYSTPEAALQAAYEVAGVRPEEWRSCEFPIVTDDGRVDWTKIVGK